MKNHEKRNSISDLKLLRFNLCGLFAHFNQPISNLFKNTYLIIPKPQLLGLLGSILGLHGYTNSRTLPEFYKELKNLKVCIIPKLKSYKRFLVKYNSLNSFLNNRVDTGSPNVIINEQVLMDPEYEIGILLNNGIKFHQQLVFNIRNNRSIFPIYLGKNEFFANIKYLSLDNCKICSLRKVTCSCILPFDNIEKGEHKMKLEMLPVEMDEKFKYVYRLMALPQKEGEITFKQSMDFVIVNQNKYYVF